MGQPKTRRMMNQMKLHSHPQFAIVPIQQQDSCLVTVPACTAARQFLGDCT